MLFVLKHLHLRNRCTCVQSCSFFGCDTHFRFGSWGYFLRWTPLFLKMCHWFRIKIVVTRRVHYLARYKLWQSSRGCKKLAITILFLHKWKFKALRYCRMCTLSVAQPYEFQPGEVVIREGDPELGMFVIHSVRLWVMMPFCSSPPSKCNEESARALLRLCGMQAHS